MTGWLLDTNVLSELRRPRPAASVVNFIQAQRLDTLFVSTVTFAEIRYGIERVSDAGRRAELTAWFTNIVRPMFAQHTLPIGEDVMLRWRLLVEAGRRTGHTYSQPDLIIAATALHHGLIIVSRDTREYQRAQVEVLNPWIESARTT